MTVTINYSNKTLSKLNNNCVFFCNEKLDIDGIKKNLSISEFNYILDLLKSSDKKKRLFIFEINSKKKIIILPTKKNIKSSEIESLGAEFFNSVKHKNISNYFIMSDSIEKKK